MEEREGILVVGSRVILQRDDCTSPYSEGDIASEGSLRGMIIRLLER